MMGTSGISIAVDAARDAAHRARTDAAESDAFRRVRLTAEIEREIETAPASELGEVVWSTLDGVGDDSRLSMLDDVLAAVRDMAAARSPFSSHAAALSVLMAWDKVKDEVIRRVVNNRMREDA